MRKTNKKFSSEARARAESIRDHLFGAAGEAGAVLSLSIERLEVPNGK
jgi:hypothetical protein